MANGEVAIVKVAGEKNVADALTKAVDGNKVSEHVSNTGGSFEEGRHDLSPEVAKDEEENLEGYELRGGDEDDGDEEGSQ